MESFAKTMRQICKECLQAAALLACASLCTGSEMLTPQAEVPLVCSQIKAAGFDHDSGRHDLNTVYVKGEYVGWKAMGGIIFQMSDGYWYVGSEIPQQGKPLDQGTVFVYSSPEGTRNPDPTATLVIPTPVPPTVAKWSRSVSQSNSKSDAQVNFVCTCPFASFRDCSSRRIVATVSQTAIAICGVCCVFGCCIVALKKYRHDRARDRSFQDAYRPTSSAGNRERRSTLRRSKSDTKSRVQHAKSVIETAGYIRHF